MIIYSSSAGSGKTFALVKEYLQIILDLENRYNIFPYKTIPSVLAITFTRNATKEMKERIISYLLELSLYEKNSTAPVILNAFNNRKIDEFVVKERAKEALNYILCNYNDFSVMTIDSFIQKMLKHFSQELDIPYRYEIILDEKSIIQYAINTLISEYNKNENISKTLRLIVEENIKQKKSFNPEDALEEYFAVFMSNETEIFNPAKLNDLEKDLSVYYKKLNKIKNIAKEIIEDDTTDITELTNGKSMKKFFEYLIEENWGKVEPLPKTIEKILTGEKKLNGPKNLNKLKDRVMKDFLQIMNIMDENFHKTRYIASMIYIYKLFAYFKKILDQYKQETNSVFLSESTSKIESLFNDGDDIIPFIYYKIGARFRHYLIDEFQDTSIKQWKALNPLVKNAISEGGHIVLVGDTKQAIYRWRGGDSAIMETEKEYGDIRQLKSNRRSSVNIVRFNNLFFDRLANSQLLYWNVNEVVQEIDTEKNDGYVEINMSEGIKEETEENEYIYKIIKDNIERGRKYRDIAILVRNNSQVEKVTSFLIDKGIPFLSEKSIAIGNNSDILFIIDSLRFFANSYRKDYMKTFLAHSIFNIPVRHIRNIENAEDVFNLIRIFYDDFKSEKLKRLYINRNNINLYTLVSSLIDIFYDEKKQSDIYFITLLDTAKIYAHKGGVSLFLEEWEDKIAIMDIAVSDNSNGINVMTIHKSKGLGFSVVILPYMNWSVGLKTGSIVPVQFQENTVFVKSTKYTKTIFEDIEDEEKKSQQDSANILYVSFTRAKEELYIIPQDNKIGQIIRKIIEEIKSTMGLKEKNGILYIGQKNKIISTTEDIDTPIFFKRYEWLNRITINKKKTFDNRFILLGNALHKLMQVTGLTYPSDQVIENISKQYELNAMEEKEIRKWVNNIFGTNIINNIKKDSYKIYREISFLDKREKSEVYRMDLLCIKGNEAIVIDYKTGEEKESDKTQLLKYKKTLENNGYKTQAFIIYADTGAEYVC